ncbi:MAG: non-canonical purine NTP diphosphatase [Bacteroidota bacterium]|nr:non-canonical purine NTP diphosphatase [Bacteroidota bacterium]
METELIFATHNLHKLQEVQSMLPDKINLVSLDEYGIMQEIPETGDTLEENALIKCKFVYNKTGQACFADDTGLEVEALNGRPGVYSARYASLQKNDDANIQKLLVELEGKENRKARFRTVIQLAWDDEYYIFEGIVNGHITNEPIGFSGFGYDPVFIPEGQERTFAEMELSEKNTMSHRARAFEKLVEWLGGR